MPKGPGTYGSTMGRPPKKKKKKVKKQPCLGDYTVTSTLNASVLPQDLAKRCVNPALKALLKPQRSKKQQNQLKRIGNNTNKNT